MRLGVKNTEKNHAFLLIPSSWYFNIISSEDFISCLKTRCIIKHNLSVQYNSYVDVLGGNNYMKLYLLVISWYLINWYTTNIITKAAYFQKHY